MPIEVITGLPGHGKTLLLIEKLHEAAKAAERPLFVCGVDGLQPGLATVLEDPTRWNDFVLDDAGTCTCSAADEVLKDAQGKEISRTHRAHVHHLVPDGSLIFVDEAWKWYGHLHNARGQPNPPHVLEFAEHRHRGLDFVMTTQGPGQLYPFLRTLIEGHTHVVRSMGLEVAQLYRWPELNDDPKSRAMRDLAIKKIWRYPREKFNSYKSATTHTIKRKIPARIFLLPVLVIVGIALAYFGLQSLSPDAMASAQEKGGASSLLEAPPTGPGPSARSKQSERMTAQEWAERFQPRIAEYPASAPAWDDRPVVSNPRLVCMIGATVGCICLTEQGTKYEMDQLKCTAYVEAGGVYDPFKPEQIDIYAAAPSDDAGQGSVDDGGASP